MANSQSSTIDHEYATVDTAPAAGVGYFTNEVNPRKKKITRLFFSIRDTTQDSSDSVVAVKLQFKCPGDTGWQEHLNNGSDWALGDRVEIKEWGGGILWRAGVVDFSAYTSGSIRFGFDW